MKQDQTVQASIDSYVRVLQEKKKPSTIRAYRNALKIFRETLHKNKINPDIVGLRNVSEQWISYFISEITHYANSTKRIYTTAVIGWFKYLNQELQIGIDLQKVRVLSQPVFNHLNQFQTHPETQYYEISRILEYLISLNAIEIKEEKGRLRLLRDRALILTLADTGLEVSIICDLRVKDIDLKRGRILRTFGEEKNKIVFLSRRVQIALRDYLLERSRLDAKASRLQSSAPIFARHDKGAGKRLRPITSTTARGIVSQRSSEALGINILEPITPISFRHYYTISFQHLIDLLHPKIFEKCKTLFEVGHYDDSIFNAMKVVEDETRLRSGLEPTDVGVDLMTKALHTKPPPILISPIIPEQESAYFLFRGVIGTFKNPRSHRFLDTSDPMKTWECLSMASLLLRLLDSTD